MAETPKDETAKPRFQRAKGGAPRGNDNGMRHGLKAGKLPKSARYIEVRVNIVRRNLESAVVESKGEVSLPDAAAIQTACRWERHAALAQRWLTKEHDKMTPEQRLNFSREIAKASAERDKAIKMLNLDRDCREDLLDKLYARPAISADGAAGTGDR